MTTDSPRPVNLDLTLPGDLHPDLLRPFVPVILVTEKPMVRGVLLGPDARHEGSRLGPWLGALTEESPSDWPSGQVTVSLRASDVAIDLEEAAGCWRVAVWVNAIRATRGMSAGTAPSNTPEYVSLFRALHGLPMTTDEQIRALRSLALRVAKDVASDNQDRG